ncbi:Inherit from COG: Methyltransferase [Seminavis robusta]|uniref:Inherit from COG: Methyltransferase n=1 Tax=Seminavis robusta TaxID=568900 RepID=A0A9N8E3L9_9STRA|nr:Inherit from COG: Methyltransferase [Seminavis robusta]|eukprot:Sro583_g170710.1 Inherit from COG: Methyltransferase (372) ;mRNA; f:52169-53284
MTTHSEEDAMKATGTGSSVIAEGTNANGSDDDSNAVVVRKRPTWEITMEKLLDECASSDNPFLNSFASSPLMERFLRDNALAKAFGRMSRSRLRKELQESAALESKLARALPGLLATQTASGGTVSRSEPGMGTTQTEDLVIWDLCCGKGFSSLWLATNTFPQASSITSEDATIDTNHACPITNDNPGKVSIHMVDTDGDINFDWINGFPNLTFHKLDIYSHDLEDAIRESTMDGQKKLIVVGIHTCGDLSRRVLQLGQLCEAYATLVSPCCCIRPLKLKKRKIGSFGYDTAMKARNFNGQVSVYQLWGWMLWGYARAMNQQQAEKSGEQQKRRTSHRIDLTAEPLMKTDKNIWLSVVAAPTTRVFPVDSS